MVHGFGCLRLAYWQPQTTKYLATAIQRQRHTENTKQSYSQTATTAGTPYTVRCWVVQLKTVLGCLQVLYSADCAQARVEREQYGANYIRCYLVLIQGRYCSKHEPGMTLQTAHGGRVFTLVIQPVSVNLPPCTLHRQSYHCHDSLRRFCFKYDKRFVFPKLGIDGNRCEMASVKQQFQQ